MKNSLLSCGYVPDTQQHGGVCMLGRLRGESMLRTQSGRRVLAKRIGALLSRKSADSSSIKFVETFHIRSDAGF